MPLRFGDYELDEPAGELRHRGRPVEIQPKPFALLALLVRERARVVPLGEIKDALWADTAVTPASLTRAISHARKALGDSTRGALIKSAARRAYRFRGDVIKLARAAETAVARPATATPFVGREEAIARLDALLVGALDARGGIALISGAAGIG